MDGEREEEGRVGVDITGEGGCAKCVCVCCAIGRGEEEGNNVYQLCTKVITKS